MLTLCIRTDKPESELYLFQDGSQIGEVVWLAHRELAETIHIRIEGLLSAANTTLADVEKIVFYKGPGSFTGLRIGASVANALSYGLGVPIVGAGGDDWLSDGTATPGDTTPVVPEYGQAPHITQQKK